MVPALCLLASGVLASGVLASRVSTPIEIRIEGGRFAVRAARLPADGVLRFVNRDRAAYTVEAPGLLPGDVTVPPGGSVEAAPLYEAGRFSAMIEEAPSAELEIEFAGRPPEDPASREAPFDVARRRGRQPLLFDAGMEPAYGAFSAFDLATRGGATRGGATRGGATGGGATGGEAARQAVLRDLYRLQEELSGERPPRELAAYLTAADWTRLRPTVGFTIGLGPSAYDARRFGARVAAGRPKGLHAFTLGAALKAKLPPGRDVVVRATSDSHWLNLRICRLAWDRLRGRISNPSLEAGYAPPHGRSPILGGFFDGIGNPTGTDRERAVYGGSGDGTMLALFRIRFDEARFARLSPAAQEALVGRRKGSGHLLPGGPPTGHRARAQNDGRSPIVRMPLVFDAGPGDTGLLFASAQASIDRQFERILAGFMLAKDPRGARDGLLGFMRFESGAYYYVPPSPPGSYPGSLRGV